MRTLPETYNRQDWPRLVAQRVNGLQSDMAAAQTSIAELSAPLAVRRITADTTATAGDFFIMADATTAPITVTLPPATINVGLVLVVKRINTGVNVVTIDADGAELIDGVLTFALSVVNSVVKLISDGTGWQVI